MVSTENQRLFEQYYQAQYDFNTLSLSEKEVCEIKSLVHEKRVDYALAPLGEKIFEWVMEQNPDIHFELIDFTSEKIDGMLYVPVNGSDEAYIILNANKPLINQIFTTAHEYYHYVKDYVKLKETPRICNFGALENVNEKKASRFAAEFLLPEEALRNEIRNYKNRTNKLTLSFYEYAAISILLTVKYQMPLKAVIYRLYEEGYLKNIEEYIENYDFIKAVLFEVEIDKKRVERLYGRENPYLNRYDIIYHQMKLAYTTGYASRKEIMRDARVLKLNEEVVQNFCGYL